MVPGSRFRVRTVERGTWNMEPGTLELWNLFKQCGRAGNRGCRQSPRRPRRRWGRWCLASKGVPDEGKHAAAIQCGEPGEHGHEGHGLVSAARGPCAADVGPRFPEHRQIEEDSDGDH